MKLDKYRFLVPVFLGALLIGELFAFWPAQPANAQCGSQASSCKNCHEVQGEMPVNADGTAWHQSHAFGDFCSVCHAGNSQATDKAAAHTGLEAPLDDVKASCQQCHVDDLMDRAQVYADALGVEIGTGAAGTSGSDGETGDSSAPPSTEIGLMASTELDINDPNLVDYVQRYNEIALGEHPINKGNLIVGALIGLILLGGGAFVLYNEGWVGVDYEKVDEYPAEMVALLPKLSRLAPPERKKLQRMLEDPQQVAMALSQLTASKEQ